LLRSSKRNTNPFNVYPNVQILDGTNLTLNPQYRAVTDCGGILAAIFGSMALIFSWNSQPVAESKVYNRVEFPILGRISVSNAKYGTGSRADIEIDFSGLASHPDAENQRNGY